MKRIIFGCLTLLLLSCSKDEENIMTSKIEKDFTITTVLRRDKQSDNEFQIGWSQWEKFDAKITWFSSVKKLVFVSPLGEIESYENCTVDGLKIKHIGKITDNTDDWVVNPDVITVDFSDNEIIRVQGVFDSRYSDDGIKYVVTSITSIAEYTIKK